MLKIIDRASQISKHGAERRTQIVTAEGEIAIEDLMPTKVIVITHNGFIKRTLVSAYRPRGAARASSA